MHIIIACVVSSPDLFMLDMAGTDIQCNLPYLRKLKQRQEAVSELTSNESPSVSLLRESILHLPDLERLLCSVYHKKVHVCTILQY